LDGALPLGFERLSLPLLSNDVRQEYLCKETRVSVVWRNDQPYSHDDCLTKKISVDGSCKIEADSCPFNANFLKHGCDTYEGASGAPILLRNGRAVFAVHQGAGSTKLQKNCAVPTSTIFNEIKAAVGDVCGKTNPLSAVQWVSTDFERSGSYEYVCK
jgi:hypothetical protein